MLAQAQLALIAPPILAAAIIAGGGTGVLSLFARPIGQAFGLMDNPAAKAHSLHSRTTPLVGGIVIVLPWIVASLLSSRVLPVQLSSDNWWPLPMWMIGTVLALVLLGAIDDRVHLSPAARLAAMFAIYTAALGAHPDFLVSRISAPLFGISFGLGVFGLPITVTGLVALTNAINMADGRNGIVIGMALIWQLGIWLLVGSDAGAASLILAASLCVALTFNLQGRLFLGDAGTYGLAAISGFSVLWLHNSPTTPISTTQAAAFFVVPAVDMLRLIVARVRRGRSPMHPDHDHLHHHIDRRFGWRIGLGVYLALVVLPLAIAFSERILATPALILVIVCYYAILRECRIHKKVSTAERSAKENVHAR